MFNMKAIVFFILACNTCFASTKFPEKMYVDVEQMDVMNGQIYIHLDHNNWIHAKCIGKDKEGMYVTESNIVKSSQSSNSQPSFEYERTWKCPYCYHYWPIGKSCQNESCPSKYTDAYIKSCE